MRIPSGFFNLFIINTLGCTDQSDVVKLNPPDESELQAGRVLSNENVYISEHGTGNFRTQCKESHISNDDPLVYPEQTGASHEHVFFGFPETDAFTTIETLESATEPSTCEGGALNQSAYWVPSIFTADGTRLEYIEPLFYYKSGFHVPAETIQVPPEGLRMTSGREMSEPQEVVSAKSAVKVKAPLPNLMKVTQWTMFLTSQIVQWMTCLKSELSSHNVGMVSTSVLAITEAIWHTPFPPKHPMLAEEDVQTLTQLPSQKYPTTLHCMLPIKQVHHQLGDCPQT